MERTRSIPQPLDKDLGLYKTWSILQLPEKGPSWSGAGSIPQPLDKDIGCKRTRSLSQVPEIGPSWSRARNIPQTLDKGLGWSRTMSIPQPVDKDPSWIRIMSISQTQDKGQGSWEPPVSSLPGSQRGVTHSLILLLRLGADDLLHVVGREPELLLAPVVPPPPARGERIKASGQILGRGGQGCPCCMRCQGVVGERVGGQRRRLS